MAPDFPRFKTLFTENWSLKLLALLLAVLTIYAIQRIINQLDEFEVPIVVKVDKEIAILKQDAKTAYITCRGSIDDLRRLDVSQLRIVVKPKIAGSAGGERVPIGPRNVEGWTRGVKIVKVRPDIVSVEFDRAVEKQVGVATPEIVGEPLVGKAEVDFEPKIVTVRGPRSKLAERKILRTEPVNVEGAVDAFTTRVNILSDGESDVWEVEPSEITVHVNIVTEALSKEWKNRPVRAMVNTDSGRAYTFTPATVDVSLLGSPQAVDRIKAEDISVFVDCINLVSTGLHRTPVAVHLPAGGNLSAAVEPPLISVRVKAHPARPKPPIETNITPETATNLTPSEVATKTP